LVHVAQTCASQMSPIESHLVARHRSGFRVGKNALSANAHPDQDRRSTQTNTHAAGMSEGCDAPASTIRGQPPQLRAIPLAVSRPPVCRRRPSLPLRARLLSLLAPQRNVDQDTGKAGQIAIQLFASNAVFKFVAVTITRAGVCRKQAETLQGALCGPLFFDRMRSSQRCLGRPSSSCCMRNAAAPFIQLAQSNVTEEKQ
jgi:hypothetical protein